MFPIDPSKLPALRTRTALLVVDPQNDFLDDEGALPIHQPLDLPEQIAHAAQAFRDNGVDIIWIRSQFEKIRSIHNEMILTADLPLGNGPASSRSRSSRAVAQAGGVTSPKCPEGFLSIGASSTLSKAVRLGTPGLEFPEEIQKAISRKDQVLSKSFYSAFKNDQILRLLRMRLVTELYICGSLTNVGVMATAYDAASHGFAITLIKDCCGFRSSIRHNAAIKQIVELTGCDVLDLDEISLIRKTPRSRASTPKVPESGPTSSSSSLYPTICKRPGDDSKQALASSDLQAALASLSIADEPSTPSRKQDRKDGRDTPSISKNEESVKGIAKEQDVQASMEKTKTNAVSDAAAVSIGSNESSAADAQPHSTVDGNNENEFETLATSNTKLEIQKALHKAELVVEDPVKADLTKAAPLRPVVAKEPTPSSPSASNDETTAGADHDKALDNGKPQSSMTTRGDTLCEGDSRVIFNILPDALADNIFDKVREEVEWQRMSHQGGEVPRLVAVQGQIEEDGSMPVYRHPSDESPPLLRFTPTVTAIKEVVEKELGHPLNHALIQFYRHGNDYISEHSDKTLDIAKDSFIANVSLGAERTMVLRTKRTPKPRDDQEGEVPGSDPPAPATQPHDLKRKSERAPLPHNSLMKMGLQTNMKWLHGIRQDKRQEREKSKEELAYAGGRISLTFRRIGTFLDSEQRRIWGQGATGKTRDSAQDVINGQTPQAVEMLRAFGRENQLSDFDWNAFYGKGFDVLHITASPRLFLSADAVVNMRVQMMLAELGIGYARGSMGPAAANTGAKDALRFEALQIKLIDTDAAKSTTQGDAAIMLYLDRVYGDRARPSNADAAKTTTGAGDAIVKVETELPSISKVEVDIGKMYTRFYQALLLQDKIRAVHSSSSADKEANNTAKPIKDLLAPWETFIPKGDTTKDGDDYLASKGGLTLADYAFWPILHDIVAQDTAARSQDIVAAKVADSAKSDNEEPAAKEEKEKVEPDYMEVSVLDKLPALKAYYDRVKSRETVAKLLGGAKEK